MEGNVKKKLSEIFGRVLDCWDDKGEFCLLLLENCLFRRKLKKGEQILIGKSKFADFREDLNGNFLVEVVEKGLLLQDLSKQLNLKIEQTRLTIFKGLIIEKNEKKFVFDYTGGTWIVIYNEVPIALTDGLDKEGIHISKKDNKYQVSGKFFRYFHTQKTLGMHSPKLLFPFKYLNNKQDLHIGSQILAMQIIPGTQ